MYVTTFYSFKGGVGRTMALVNAAVELTKRGRRVLAVDFDLEAPGLDTFDVMRPRKSVPGVIDFVSEYLASGQAPEASRFISKASGITDHDGRLWMMPSGRDETYAKNFNQIDWGVLYDRHDGFLLFEDLKAQWNRVVNPDYVLIDSRTGHTDTGGICTRQLPDAVAILFFPNEQNLRGLTKVVRDIRSEALEPRKKPIQLHFVMSNVPDLDDEDRILSDQIKAFQTQLGFRTDPMVVHRYDSLSLLNQVVFAKDRPRSRLAREYRRIVREISGRNWADRDGALDYISRAAKRWRGNADESIQAREDMLEKIEDAHSRDGEVLFRLGELRDSVRQPEWAVSLYNRAIDAGYDRPETYLKRARIRAENGDRAGASEDALHVLEFDEVSPPMVRDAILRTVSLTPAEIADSNAVTSLDLDDKIWLASTFDRSPAEIRIALPIWKRINSDNLPAEKLQLVRHHLGLSYIGIGRCSDAVTVLRQGARSDGGMAIADAFNCAMAMWGESGTPDAEAFLRVVELNQSNSQKHEGPNYLQCMAIAYWASGNTETAIEYVDQAQQAIRTTRRATVLSCWCYCRVNAGTFVADLDEIRTLIDGETSLMPRFMAASEK